MSTKALPDSNNGSPAEEEIPSIEPLEVPTESKPFFITRVLRALLPRSWIYTTERPLPCSKPPWKPLLFLDWIIFTHSFPLIWASATGRILEAVDFPPLSPSCYITSKIDAFKAEFSTLNKNTGSKPKSQIPLLSTLLPVSKHKILEGITCHTLYVLIDLIQVLLYKVIIAVLAMDGPPLDIQSI